MDTIRSGDPITAKVQELTQHKDRAWAVRNFLPTVREMIVLTGARSVLEVGGGRAPSLDRETIDRLGLRYTSSDISARELALAPPWVETALFDIQAPEVSEIDPYRGQFDFAFSKWVMEHVADYRRAYANIYEILADGGVYIAYHPLRFSLPFILNQITPEAISAPLLRAFFPERNDNEFPKFPAHYSGCRISKRVRRAIREIGFTDVWQLPFYGHGYYSKIPILRGVHAIATRRLRDVNMTAFAAFAYTIVRK